MPTINHVMVTGASGKLGVPLCEALVAAGYRVTGLRHRHPVGVAGVEEVRADLADATAMERLILRHDAVIHPAMGKEERHGGRSLQRAFRKSRKVIRLGHG